MPSQVLEKNSLIAKCNGVLFEFVKKQYWTDWKIRIPIFASEDS